MLRRTPTTSSRSPRSVPKPQETPTTAVALTYTVFHDTIETEWATWDGFQERVETVIAELGDFRTKSEDAYRRAARDVRSARHGTDTVTQVAALLFQGRHVPAPTLQAAP
jgi:hypothetical protein